MSLSVQVFESELCRGKLQLEREDKFMPEVTLEHVLKQIKQLEPDEQRELRKALDEMLGIPSSESVDDTARRWQEEVLIITSPPPITDFSRYENRKLAKVKGKPVSEVIIEERR
jgi:hypothetical protein